MGANSPHWIPSAAKTGSFTPFRQHGTADWWFSLGQCTYYTGRESPWRPSLVLLAGSHSLNQQIAQHARSFEMETWFSEDLRVLPCHGRKDGKQCPRMAEVRFAPPHGRHNDFTHITRETERLHQLSRMKWCGHKVLCSVCYYDWLTTIPKWVYERHHDKKRVYTGPAQPNIRRLLGGGGEKRPHSQTEKQKTVILCPFEECKQEYELNVIQQWTAEDLKDDDPRTFVNKPVYSTVLIARNAAPPDDLRELKVLVAFLTRDDGYDDDRRNDPAIAGWMEQLMPYPERVALRRESVEHIWVALHLSRSRVLRFMDEFPSQDVLGDGGPMTEHRYGNKVGEGLRLLNTLDKNVSCILLAEASTRGAGISVTMKLLAPLVTTIISTSLSCVSLAWASSSQEKCTHSMILGNHAIDARVPRNHETITTSQRDYGSLYYPHTLLARCMVKCPDLRRFFVRLSLHAQANMHHATLYVMRSLVGLFRVWDWESQSLAPIYAVDITQVETTANEVLEMVFQKSSDLVVREFARVCLTGTRRRRGSFEPSVSSVRHTWCTVRLFAYRWGEYWARCGCGCW